MPAMSFASRPLMLALSLALALTLAGCAATVEEQVELPVDQLYNTALDEVIYGDITIAAPLFDEVERQHPYSDWAVRSQLLSAWSLYASNQYAPAIAAFDRFIELNPAHIYTDYAFYMKAQSYYEQIIDVERDASITRQAKEAFEALLNRFPNSRYARDSRLKLDLTLSHLAGKEMAVGRFYLKAGHFNAGLRRFEIVINDYQTSNQVPEALYRMVEGYLGLGLVGEAERTGAVLQYNYPYSIWTSRMRRLIDVPLAEAAAAEAEATQTQ
ncbi:MAG: outer membrane protein assembly factor BamD [Proteobacteria bacterium]|nr:outer membrane protein assembly factor BamD [Pseudomonadota bacterium]